MRHKLVTFVAAILIAVFALVLFSYATLGNQVAQNESNLVAVRVETDKPSYLTGEVVKIRTYLTNVGNETIKTYGMKERYEFVNTKDGSATWLIRYSDYFTEYPFTLTPQNETELLIVEWNLSFTTGQGSSDVKKVTPGTYRIEVTISFSGYTLNDTPQEKLVNFYSETSIQITGA